MAQKYTNEDLLNILKTFYVQHGRSPKRREIKQFDAISKRFGTWNNALEKAGLPILKKKWTKEELIKAVDDMVEKHGRALSVEEINNDPYLFDSSTFRKIVGVPYTKYIENIGLKPSLRLPDKKYLEMTNEELLDEFKKELERIGTNQWRVFNKERKQGFPSDSYMRKRFNCSWEDLLQKIKIDSNFKRLTKKEFVDWYLNILEEKGYVPTYLELNHQYSFFKSHLRKYFKNYAAMCKTLNIQQPAPSPTAVSETDEELLDMYIKFSENLGRPATSKELNSSDEIYNSDVFVLRFGSMNELKKLCGYDEYVTKSKKRYTKEEIKLKLIRYYKENGGRLTNSELKKLISISTVLRYFRTTKMSVVWEEIEKEIEIEK